LQALKSAEITQQFRRKFAIVSSEMLRMVTRKYVPKIPRLLRLRDAQKFWETAEGLTNFFSTTIYYDGNQSISVGKLNPFSSFMRPKFWLRVVFSTEAYSANFRFILHFSYI
jgi:hypothetical protein